MPGIDLVWSFRFSLEGFVAPPLLWFQNTTDHLAPEKKKTKVPEAKELESFLGLPFLFSF